MGEAWDEAAFLRRLEEARAALAADTAALLELQRFKVPRFLPFQGSVLPDWEMFKPLWEPSAKSPETPQEATR